MATNGDDRRKLTYSEIPGLLAVAMPLVLAPGAGIALLLQLFGYHDRKVQGVFSIAGIFVASLVVFGFEGHLRRPSRLVKVAVAICYVILALLLWARISHLLPTG